MLKTGEQAIKGTILKVSELENTDIEKMFALFSAYYDGTDKQNFVKDLKEKHWIIMLKTGEEINGFSTQMVIRGEHSQGKFAVLFSGDTIVDKKCWGETELAVLWTKLSVALSEMYKQKGSEFYWYLISKGYKTYKFLPVFFNEYYPAADRVVPGKLREIMKIIAQTKFPGLYDEHTGIIRGSDTKERLKKGIADIDEKQLKNAHVRFFAEKNPGWAKGDELVCIAPVSRSNFNKSGLRLLDNTSVLTRDLQKIIMGGKY